MLRCYQAGDMSVCPDILYQWWIFKKVVFFPSAAIFFVSWWELIYLRWSRVLHTGKEGAFTVSLTNPEGLPGTAVSQALLLWRSEKFVACSDCWKQCKIRALSSHQHESVRQKSWRNLSNIFNSRCTVSVDLKWYTKKVFELMVPKGLLGSRISYSCFSNFFLTTSLIFWALTSITPTVFFRGAIHLKQSESVQDLHGLCLLALLSGTYTELPQVCLPRAKQELCVSFMLYLRASFKNKISGVGCNTSVYAAQREGCWKQQYKCIAAYPRQHHHWGEIPDNWCYKGRLCEIK